MGAYEYNKRWRERHPATRLSGKKRNYALTQGAPNTGKGWTGDEERQVLAREVTDRELSTILGRSVQAIQVRRALLNRSEV